MHNIQCTTPLSLYLAPNILSSRRAYYPLDNAQIMLTPLLHLNNVLVTESPILNLSTHKHQQLVSSLLKPLLARHLDVHSIYTC